MKALTLEDCKKVKITDLWLGIAIFKATDKDAEAINAQKSSPEEMEKRTICFWTCIRLQKKWDWILKRQKS